MATWIWATDANAGPAGAMTWLVTAPTSYASGWVAPYTPFYSMATVQVTSVPDMVTKVLAAAGSDKIERLVLYGHAASGAQAVGCGEVINLGSKTNDFLAVSQATGTLANGAELDLARLAPQLAPNARVSLGGCNVAAPPGGQALLIRISTALGGSPLRGECGSKHRFSQATKGRSFGAPAIPAQTSTDLRKRFDKTGEVVGPTRVCIHSLLVGHLFFQLDNERLDSGGIVAVGEKT